MDQFLHFGFAGLWAFGALMLGKVLLLALRSDFVKSPGLCGLIGMGVGGSLLGLLILVAKPGAVIGLAFLVLMALPLIALVLILLKKYKEKISAFQRRFKLEFSGAHFAVLAVLLISLIGALTPSTALDWDSIAYHLAVPKIWLEQGHASSVSFIHHSNFPGAADAWFILGESLGSQSMSKSFMWFTSLFGCWAIFDVFKHWYKPNTALLCAVAFASIPMVLWESGSAYIDVANGLFAGFGFLFAAKGLTGEEKSDLWLSAIFLGLAASSKYTGLQSILIATTVWLILGEAQQRKGALKLVGAAGAIAAPWYIKNWITVGNPVYPFFYSLFGGKNWDTFQSFIYSREQKNFGYEGVANAGQSIFGLVTSPGRFTNPSPKSGTGFAFVSLGMAVISTAVIGVCKGLTSKTERALGLMVLFQFGAWLLLSQQSRYILALAVPLLFLGAIALEQPKTKVLSMVLVVLQVPISLYLYSTSIVAERLPVFVGGLTRDEFLGGYQAGDGGKVPGAVSIYGDLKPLASDATITKIGLYDEVFGYYCPKPYIWASPGHTTEFGYAEMTTTDQLIAAYKKMGISHIYVTNRYIRGTETETQFLNASGLSGTVVPYPTDVREAALKEQETKWRILVAEAIGEGKLKLHTQFSQSRFLFSVQ